MTLTQPQVLRPGDVLTGARGEVFRTLLGSCVSVCLFDLIPGLGGMNHLTLPGSSPGATRDTRYGRDAIDELLNALLARGARRDRLRAKLFGAAHVLDLTGSEIASANAGFAREYLESLHIPIAAQSLGGTSARDVMFFPATGRTLVRVVNPRPEPELCQKSAS